MVPPLYLPVSFVGNPRCASAVCEIYLAVAMVKEIICHFCQTFD